MYDNYYLALAGDTPHQPTLADLAPLIEVVYHACRARAYDEAYVILQDRIYQRWPARVLVNQLGAWETAIKLMQQFFPNGDTSQEPQVSQASNKSWILNEVGLCLMNLGRLATAVPFFERKTKMQLEYEDWQNASHGYMNLAELNTHLGWLAASATAAEEALTLARRAENNFGKCVSMSYLAHAYYLQGEMASATEWFQKAEELEQNRGSNINYLYSDRGVFHAEHLRWVGQADYARQVTAANLTICERNRVASQISQCHRVLGELDADEGKHTTARDHFDTALTIARPISHRPSLIEALLARGRWAAKLAFADLTGGPQQFPPTKGSTGHLSGLGTLQQAFSDLREALGYATDGGYRIYEADSRIALAWAHLANGNPTAARQEVTRAQTMSTDMGYRWGQVDAAEVLDHL